MYRILLAQAYLPNRASCVIPLLKDSMYRKRGLKSTYQKG
jgi:hypothetical protein